MIDQHSLSCQNDWNEDENGINGSEEIRLEKMVRSEEEIIEFVMDEIGLLLEEAVSEKEISECLSK